MKCILAIFVSALALCPVSAQETTRELWVAWTTGKHTLHDGTVLPFWGFSKGFKQPELPGPLMTAIVGDSLILDVRNQSQPYSHTMHLHGTDVEQEYDGVPGLSWQLDHMETGTYRMLVPHPGLYFYHCHVASVVHVQLGMYGPLLVYPSNPSTSWEGGYEINPQRTVSLFSDIDKSWHDEVPEHPHKDSGHVTFPIPEFIPDYFLHNGDSHPELFVEFPEGNSMWYVGNMGFTGVRILGLGHEELARIVSSDGRPLPNALRKDTLLIMPGERYGVLLNDNQFGAELSVEWISMNTSEVLHTKALHATFATTVEQNQTNSSTVFYDASTHSLVVETLTGNGIDDVKVVDVLGKCVDTQVHSANGISHVLLAPQTSGVVFVHVSTESSIQTAKVLIAR